MHFTSGEQRAQYVSVLKSLVTLGADVKQLDFDGVLYAVLGFLPKESALIQLIFESTEGVELELPEYEIRL